MIPTATCSISGAAYSRLDETTYAGEAVIYHLLEEHGHRDRWRWQRRPRIRWLTPGRGTPRDRPARPSANRHLQFGQKLQLGEDGSVRAPEVYWARAMGWAELIPAPSASIFDKTA